MKNKDLHNCNLYIVNGIICEIIDFQKYIPTIKDVRRTWNFPTSTNITDNEIQFIIDAVVKLTPSIV